MFGQPSYSEDDNCHLYVARHPTANVPDGIEVTRALLGDLKYIEPHDHDYGFYEVDCRWFNPPSELDRKGANEHKASTALVVAACNDYGIWVWKTCAIYWVYPDWTKLLIHDYQNTWNIGDWKPDVWEKHYV
jgi:hypothetical protein